MKTFFCYLLCAMALNLSLLAQTSTNNANEIATKEAKHIYATIGEKIDLSKKGYEAWKAEEKKYRSLIDKLSTEELNIDSLTTEQTNLLDKEMLFELPFNSVGDYGCSWYCGADLDSEIIGSSTLKPAGSINYQTQNIHDSDLATAWVEGVEGSGIGESVTFTMLPNCPPITQISIYNGYCKSEKTYEENNRVRMLNMYVGEHLHATLHLEDTYSEQIFEVDTIAPTNDKKLALKFEIVEVYEGTKYEDTAISDFIFDGIGVHCFAAGTPIRLADGSSLPIEQLSIGSAVMTYNFKTATLEPSSILKLATQKHHHLVQLQFEVLQEEQQEKQKHLSPKSITITATQDHPFWVAQKGWASLQPEASKYYDNINEATNLALGDICWIAGADGQLQKVSLTQFTLLDNCQDTYTIVELDKHQNFFANGILVGAENTSVVVETK